MIKWIKKLFSKAPSNHHPRFIDEKPWESNSCLDCKNWGTMDCPNSNLCFSRADHPYFTPKTKEKDDSRTSNTSNN